MENKKIKKIPILMGIVIVIIASITFFISRSNDLINSGGKKLIIGRGNDSIGLDPAVLSDTESFQVCANIYDTLVEVENGKFTPSLAQSWEVSEDGLVWTFDIRKNVKFQDGTVCDAKAIEFNFKRWMNDNSQYHVGKFPYWNYSFSGFPGIVKSVTALSKNKLEIVLDTPYSPMLSTLSIPAFSIASPEAIIKYNEKLFENPVGTGPFRLKEWTKGKNIILERNPDYWGESAKIKELEFLVVESQEDRMKMLSDGIIDIAENLSSNQKKEIEEDNMLKLHLKPFLNVSYLAINNKKDLLSNKSFRLAIYQMINKDEIIQESFDSFSRTADYYIPPVSWAYNKNISTVKYDVEKARSSIKKLNIDTPIKLNLMVMDSPREYMLDPIKTANILKEQLAKGGIELNIRVVAWDNYVEMLKKGEYDMALVGWKADTSDPDNFLHNILYSRNNSKGISMNYSYYKNIEVDKLLEKGRNTSDIEFRKKIYSTIQSIVTRDVPSVPLAHTMPAIGISLKVKNFEPKSFGEESFELVEIEDE